MIKILDTTLRDGTQQEGLSLSLHDKLKIAKKLDDLGVSYIEAGWPGSNPKDNEFFELAKKEKWKNSALAAFGSTHHKKFKAQADPNLLAIVKSAVKVAVIFGKTWDLHVKEILNVSLNDNLKMIEDSVAFLKSKGLEVIFDCEHFFDGFKHNSEYALKCIEAAEKGGADNVTLCDTNGGTLISDLVEAIDAVVHFTAVSLGIHAHNDCELAVANSLAAVDNGIELIHGTINGYGERVGNANLCSIIPTLQLKKNYKIVEDEKLEKLTSLSRYVQELANLRRIKNLPYVGDRAFAHKGGIHVSAILKNKESYEHIDPAVVGNKTNVTVSELSGQSNILAMAKEMGIKLEKGSALLKEVLKKVKLMENQGFQFEGAEQSFELLLRRQVKGYKAPFSVVDFFVRVEKKDMLEHSVLTEATVKVEIDGEIYHTTADGNGPVNALDKALRKAILFKYPKLKEVELLDYKVRILDSHLGTGAKTRVLIESGTHDKRWCTVGCSENIIDASMQALIDGLEYFLI